MKGDSIPAVYYERLTSLGGGGAERVAIEEAQHLGVPLLTFEVSKTILEYNHDTTLEKPLRIWLIWYGLLRGGSKLRTALVIPFRLLALIITLLRVKPDVIITAWKGGGWLTVYLATRLTRTPYVIHYHATSWWFNRGAESWIKYSRIHRKTFHIIAAKHPEVNPKLQGSLAKIAVGPLARLDYLSVTHAKAILVLSKKVAWEVKEMYGVDAKVLPVTAGLSQSSLSPDIAKAKYVKPEQKVVLSVSTLKQEKRVDILIDAFQTVGNDAVLVIAGTGEDGASLRDKVLKMGLSDKVKFAGFVPDSELRAYYEMCSLFATAAWGDFVTTLYEALSVGKRVVCSTEIELDDEARATQLVIQADPTPDAFAKAISVALTQGPKKTEAKLPSWQGYVDNVLGVCQEVVK